MLNLRILLLILIIIINSNPQHELSNYYVSSIAPNAKHSLTHLILTEKALASIPSPPPLHTGPRALFKMWGQVLFLVKVLQWLPRCSRKLQLFPLIYKPAPPRPAYCLFTPAAHITVLQAWVGCVCLFSLQRHPYLRAFAHASPAAWKSLPLPDFKCFHIMESFLQTSQILLALFSFIALSIM